MLTNAHVIFGGLTDAAIAAAAGNADMIHTLNSFNSTFNWGTYLRDTSTSRHMDYALVRLKSSCYSKATANNLNSNGQKIEIEKKKDLIISTWESLFVLQKDRIVFKYGMASAVTLGRFVKNVEQTTLKIKGTPERLFSLPGDSGSLVYLQDEDEDDDSKKKLIPIALHYQSSDTGFSFAIPLWRKNKILRLFRFNSRVHRPKK
jgi:hypothetical protein